MSGDLLLTSAKRSARVEIQALRIDKDGTPAFAIRVVVDAVVRAQVVLRDDEVMTLVHAIALFRASDSRDARSRRKARAA